MSLYDQVLFRFAGVQTICPDGSDACQTDLSRIGASANNLQTILQIVFGALAAVAVIIIIVGGLKLVLSQGDAQALAKARKTVIYAAVGFVVALCAELIVTFVLVRI